MWSNQNATMYKTLSLHKLSVSEISQEAVSDNAVYFFQAEPHLILAFCDSHCDAKKFPTAFPLFEVPCGQSLYNFQSFMHKTVAATSCGQLCSHDKEAGDTTSINTMTNSGLFLLFLLTVVAYLCCQ